MAWCLTEGRPHFVHGQQFRECAMSLRWSFLTKAFANYGWRVCPAASCPPVSILSNSSGQPQTLPILGKELYDNAIIPTLQAEICFMFKVVWQLKCV